MASSAPGEDEFALELGRDLARARRGLARRQQGEVALASSEDDLASDHGEIAPGEDELTRDDGELALQRGRARDRQRRTDACLSGEDRIDRRQRNGLIAGAGWDPRHWRDGTLGRCGIGLISEHEEMHAIGDDRRLRPTLDFDEARLSIAIQLGIDYAGPQDVRPLDRSTRKGSADLSIPSSRLSVPAVGCPCPARVSADSASSRIRQAAYAGRCRARESLRFRHANHAPAP